MIIALFPNTSKKQSLALSIGIREFLTQQGVTVVADDKEAELIGATKLKEVDAREIQYILSMGGDGTILQLMHKYPNLDIPILGINLGHLGFMADVPISEIYPSLQDLLNGAFTVQERVMIHGETLSGDQCFAVNDIVIHRGKRPTLIEVAIHVDGLYLNTFEADGVIIATPNGSTAYSLAAGGPILNPELDAIVITPVSPHTISNRPIVLKATSEIQIQYLTEGDQAEVRADGISLHILHTGEVFRIFRHKKTFKSIHLHRNDYFATLRTKLAWSGKLR